MWDVPSKRQFITAGEQNIASVHALRVPARRCAGHGNAVAYADEFLANTEDAENDDGWRLDIPLYGLTGGVADAQHDLPMRVPPVNGFDNACDLDCSTRI